jgi:hypothetical protein
MKTISPVQSWINGQSVQATILNAYAVNVALSTSAIFYYSLLDDKQVMVAQGNLTMSGADYQKWSVDQYAWDFIASELKLTITGDYVAPIVEKVIAE